MILRVPYLAIPFFCIDEGVYATAAREVLRGERLYTDLWLHKPPGIVYIYALIFLVKDSMTAVHLFTALWSFATSIAIYRAMRLLSDHQSSLLAAIFYAFFSTSYLPRDMQAANTELFMVLPLVLSFGFLVVGMKRQRLGYLFSAGLFCSLGMIFKQPALFVAVAFIMAIILHYRKQETINKCILALVTYCIGIMVPLVVLILWAYKSGSLGDMLRLVVGYNLGYVSDIHPLQYLYRAYDISIRFFGYNFLLLWLALVWLFASKPAKEDDKENGRLLLLFLLGSLLGTASGNRFFGHYFIQSLPALCMVAAVALSSLFTNIQRIENGLICKSLCGSLIILVVLGFIIPFQRFHGYGMIDSLGRLLEGEGASPLVREIASKPHDASLAELVKSITEPGDKIFIWGFYPQLYYLSGRRPASRFIFCNFLTGLQPGSAAFFEGRDTSEYIVTGSRELLMEDLGKNRPRVIIDTAPADYWGYSRYPIDKYWQLNAFIAKDYRLYATVEGFAIYQRW